MENMEGMENMDNRRQGRIRPFRVLVNLNIPIEIDQSLSWYNALLKIGYRLNDVIGVVNEIAATTGEAYGPDNPPPYPVTSVNGKVGDVVIDIDDIDKLRDALDLIDTQIDTLGKNDTTLQNNINKLKQQIDNISDNADEKINQFEIALSNFAITETEDEFALEDYSVLEENGTKLVFVTRKDAPDKTAQRIYYMNGDEPWLFTPQSIRVLTLEQFTSISQQERVDDYNSNIVMYSVSANDIVTLYMLREDGSTVSIASGGGEGGAVTSVNGMTGAVILTAANVGAASQEALDALAQRVENIETGSNLVTSVNGMTGDVVIGASDVGAASEQALQEVSDKLDETEGRSKTNEADILQLKGDVANAQADAEEAQLALKEKYGPDNPVPYMEYKDPPETKFGVGYEPGQASLVFRGENDAKIVVKFRDSQATIAVNDGPDVPISGDIGDAYTPDNPPPYPVTSVNQETGDVIVRSMYNSKMERIYCGDSTPASNTLPLLRFINEDGEYAALFMNEGVRLRVAYSTTNLGNGFDTYSTNWPQILNMSVRAEYDNKEAAHYIPFTAFDGLVSSGNFSVKLVSAYLLTSGYGRVAVGSVSADDTKLYLMFYRGGGTQITTAGNVHIQYRR